MINNELFDKGFKQFHYENTDKEFFHVQLYLDNKVINHIYDSIWNTSSGDDTFKNFINAHIPREADGIVEYSVCLMERHGDQGYLLYDLKILVKYLGNKKEGDKSIKKYQELDEQIGILLATDYTEFWYQDGSEEHILYRIKIEKTVENLYSRIILLDQLPDELFRLGSEAAPNDDPTPVFIGVVYKCPDFDLFFPLDIRVRKFTLQEYESHLQEIKHRFEEN